MPTTAHVLHLSVLNKIILGYFNYTITLDFSVLFKCCLNHWDDNTLTCTLGITTVY